MTEQEFPPATGAGPSDPWPAGLAANLGMLALFGWLFGWAGFAGSPGWAVAAAFPAAAGFQFFFRMIRQSVIENAVLLLAALVGFMSVRTFEIPLATLFFAALACGMLGCLVTGLRAGVRVPPGGASRVRGETPKARAEKPLRKAERRERDDALRRRKNEQERRLYESRTAFPGDENPAEDQ